MTGQSSRWTELALRSGGLLAVTIFGAGFVLRLLGSVESAAVVSSGGVLVVIATPAVALVATAAETWRADRATALLAAAVLAVLAAALLVALTLSG